MLCSDSHHDFTAANKQITSHTHTHSVNLVAKVRPVANVTCHYPLYNIGSLKIYLHSYQVSTITSIQQQQQQQLVSSIEQKCRF